MKKILFISIFLLTFACSKQEELSQEEIDARIEAARKTDSLLNSYKKVEEEKNLTQTFSGIHGAHTIMGTGNLAFDAHQDPVRTRRLMRSYALLAERQKAQAPKIEEARRKMMENYKKAQEEEKARIY